MIIVNRQKILGEWTEVNSNKGTYFLRKSTLENDFDIYIGIPKNDDSNKLEGREKNITIELITSALQSYTNEEQYVILKQEFIQAL